MIIDKELFADALPTYLTRFVGRDREVAAVLSMLLPGGSSPSVGSEAQAKLGWLSKRQSAAGLTPAR